MQTCVVVKKDERLIFIPQMKSTRRFSVYLSDVMVLDVLSEDAVVGRTALECLSRHKIEGVDGPLILPQRHSEAVKGLGYRSWDALQSGGKLMSLQRDGERVVIVPYIENSSGGFLRSPKDSVYAEADPVALGRLIRESWDRIDADN